MDKAEGVLLSNRSTDQMRIKETGIGSAQLAGSKRWGTIAWAFREGTGNPLQYSCLENPKDSGAWWAAIYGVTQSVTGND